MELSDEAISFSKKSSQANLCKGNALKLPFKSDRFDIIYSAGLIEHFQDTIQPLNEMNRCLKDNGYIVLTVPGFSIFYIYKILGKVFGFWKLGYERNFTIKSIMEESKKWNGNTIEVGAIGNLGLCFVSSIIFQKFSNYNTYSHLMDFLDTLPKKPFPKEIWMILRKRAV